MNLQALQAEVLAHGFDAIQYGNRINQYINDALALICRRVDYYVDEATQAYATVSGTNLLTLPTGTLTTPPWAPYPISSGGFARIRELLNPSVSQTLEAVSLRDIDGSAKANGQPYFYAIDGPNLHLYPTPDNVYNLLLRYWTMPQALLNSTDTPSLPQDWHHLLWVYATWMCFEADDDAQMGQYWQQRFNTELAEFAADQKFPSTDTPTQVDGMWDSGRSLSPTGGTWSLYGGYG